MKILLYSEGMSLIKKSGIGKTLSHQMKALEKNNIEYTLDPQDSFDLAHINTVGPNSHHLAQMCNKIGKKVVYHAHSTEEDFRNSFIFSNVLSPHFKKWLIKCYTLGDVVVTPTPYAKKILEGYGIEQDIYAISNGIELEYFSKDPVKGTIFRQRFGFSPEDKIVMAVGLYIERKGILDFVALAKKMPEYKFIWFGHTPLYSVPAKIGKAVKTKLPNLFFPGYVDSDILRSAYCGSDLFIFPTYEETEGIVLLEALATKQNVLIRDIPIYEGWLENNQNIYKADSLDGFEKSIHGILENTLPSLIEPGYKIACQRDLKHIGKQLHEIYQKVLSM